MSSIFVPIEMELCGLSISATCLVLLALPSAVPDVSNFMSGLAVYVCVLLSRAKKYLI